MEKVVLKKKLHGKSCIEKKSCMEKVVLKNVSENSGVHAPVNP